MTKFAILVAAGAALAGCVSPPPAPPRHQPVQLTQEQIAKIHEGVHAALADPQSASFGAIYAGRYDANIIGVCGFVNARNRMGGMSGMMPFRGALMGNGPGQVYRNHAIVSDHDVAVATVQVCRRAGIMPGG